MIDLRAIFENSQKVTSTNRDERVLIIDSLNTWLRIVSSMSVINDNGIHVGGIIGMLRSIGKEIREFDATRCILVFDGSGGSLRRRKLFPNYKLNRTGKFKPKRPEGYELTDEEERASLNWQMERVFRYLECLPVQVITIDNIEADDTIAHICAFYNNHKNKVRIVSTDRDFLQLVSDQVEVYSPVKKLLYEPNNISQEFGFHTKNYLLYRTLTGDVSDNIPGISGLGLKTMLKYFPELIDSELGLEDLLTICEEKVKEKKPKVVYKTLLEQREQVELNYKLMQLSDVDISGTSKLKITEQLNRDIPFVDKGSFKQLLIEDCLNTAFKYPDDWLYQTFNRLNTWATR